MTRALLFGGRFPVDSVDIDEVVVIDGRGLIVPNCAAGTRFLSSELAVRDAALIQDEIERRWHQFCDQRDEFSSQYSYIYFTTVGALVYWKCLAEDYVRLPEVCEIVVAGSLSHAFSVGITDRSTFLQWASRAFWAPELGHLQMVKSEDVVGGARTWNPLQSSIEALGYAVLAWRFLARSTSRRIPRRDQTTLPTVLVVAQAKKATELCRELREFFNVIVLDEIVKDYALGVLDKPLDLINTHDVFVAAEEFVDALIAEGREHFETARNFIDELRPVAFITDHEYDPLVRELASRRYRGECPPIAIIPEGAQTLLHPTARRYFDNWVLREPGVFRFSLTAEEALEAHQAYGQEGAVTGYLGDTLRFSELLATLVRWLLRVGRTRPLAVVNVDSFSNEGFGRPGRPTSEQELIILDRAVAGLHGAGWDCALTCRDPSLASHLRDCYPSNRMTIHLRCPWQLLAKASDVVIQSSSSIGPESLRIGVPAIAWNPLGFPLISQGEIDRGEIYLARDEGELRTALKLALKRPRAESSAGGQGKVTQWIVRLPGEDAHAQRPV